MKTTSATAAAASRPFRLKSGSFRGGDVRLHDRCFVTWRTRISARTDLRSAAPGVERGSRQRRCSRNGFPRLSSVFSESFREFFPGGAILRRRRGRRGGRQRGVARDTLSRRPADGRTRARNERRAFQCGKINERPKALSQPWLLTHRRGPLPQAGEGANAASAVTLLGSCCGLVQAAACGCVIRSSRSVRSGSRSSTGRSCRRSSGHDKIGLRPTHT